MYEMTGPHVFAEPPNMSRDLSACPTTDRTRFADPPKEACCADPTGWSGRAPDPKTGRRTQPPTVLHCRSEDRPANSAGMTAPLCRSEDQTSFRDQVSPPSAIRRTPACSTLAEPPNRSEERPARSDQSLALSPYRSPSVSLWIRLSKSPSTQVLRAAMRDFYRPQSGPASGKFKIF